MPDHVYKTIEITGTSQAGVTEAIQVAVDKASSTVRNLDWFELVTLRGHLAEGGIDHFQATVKIGFRLD